MKRSAGAKPSTKASTKTAASAAPAAPAAPRDAASTRAVLQGKRFLAADRAGLDIAEIATWDRYLLREHRLLVPIDVQALYVPKGAAGDAEPMLRLPMMLAGTETGNEDGGMPPPFAKGTPRESGVHLHWAMPDALLRGSLADAPAGGNRLALPVLPDRWVVLRLVQPRGGREVVQTGWVIEADRAVAVPLAQWSEGGAASTAAPAAGVELKREQLTGTVGGGASWAAVYDAVLNRFAFHDPLTDLPALAPAGADEDCATYVVAGWWSDPVHDPLDSARSSDSLDELLERLRWRLMFDWGDQAWALEQQRQQEALRQALGLTSAERWSGTEGARPVKAAVKAVPRGAGQAPPGATSRGAARGASKAAAKATSKAAAKAASKATSSSSARAAAGATPFTPVDRSIVAEQPLAITSVFASDAAERFTAPPWQLRSSLLHGAVYGVPVAGGVLVDRRPAPTALSVAFGQHGDDVVGAFASQGDSVEEQRATERLFTAFTAQKVNRLASPDGVVELEEHEHASAFASLPAGNACTDRFLQRVQTGRVGGLNLGRGVFDRSVLGAAKSRAAAGKAASSAPPTRHAHPVAAAARAAAPQAALALQANTLLAFGGKPALVQATVSTLNDLARSRVGDVLAPTEARIVQRPAPRWTFPTDPLIGLRGASRSLRHGGDGRASADGKLTCRWPTHVIQEITGLVARERFLRSLGNGGVPGEVLTLAREALLHDPYHDEWLATAVAPPGFDVKRVLARLQAESLLRFGADGTYDGSTSAFNPKLARTAAARRIAARAPARPLEPGERETQTLLADELRRFSLVKGVDPDPVGVTTWAQPWVPMWLEWEVKVEGLDPPALEAWRLATIDLEHAGSTVPGGTLVLTGRSLLTTGVATTLHHAIADWLLAEDKLDAVQAGLVDEDTERAYRTLDAAVQHLDVVSASLDGLRAHLLGLAVTDGLRRPIGGSGGVRNPAPVAPPFTVLAGALSLQRARLVDSFGRTLDVPAPALAQARLAARDSIAARPGALACPPRLLRPARWSFRLVDAATGVGAEGSEARVDQVEPALMVNPVAGFVMPDHLDESLELFGIDGAPIGELLHEPVSGGVMWEIAAGREGPADAGPHHGLAPAQAALANFAAALVAADAAARAGAPLGAGTPGAEGDEADEGSGAGQPSESALSALLRAIDTTLWTVDSFAALGSEHVAGLVGRPIAVVRAQLRLELMPPDDIDLSDPARAAEWQAAEQAAKRHAFAVRIGELTRSDDGVLGFFVDDDYSRFRLVDKVIAAVAADAGRSRGKLGLLGDAPGAPQKAGIEHPYIAGRDEDDTLALHIGQTVTLTIFMHPSGKCSLTSGLLPRRTLALARDWVGPGLAKIAPSLRTGPVLVETDLDPKGQVRLPKVSVFGKDQNFLWRDTPATWRSDAILAATQTALLPDTPAEFREGWIRVAPEAPDAGGEGGT
ncbi:MAG: hypothetical protein HZC37_28810 [Burkholderiales bacterium]|nr:hypothetical protein [Burkholderiales bacterium]